MLKEFVKIVIESIVTVYASIAGLCIGVAMMGYMFMREPRK